MKGNAERPKLLQTSTRESVDLFGLQSRTMKLEIQHVPVLFKDGNRPY